MRIAFAGKAFVVDKVALLVLTLVARYKAQEQKWPRKVVLT